MADLCSGSNFIKHYLKRESLAELEEKVMGNKKKAMDSLSSSVFFVLSPHQGVPDPLV